MIWKCSCQYQEPVFVFVSRLMTILEINSRNTLCVVLLALGINVPEACLGAVFHNLDFEEATVLPTPVGGHGDMVSPALAFPGWGIGTDGTLNPNFTLYNSLTLGSVAQVLVGPNFPNAIGLSPLQGNYSALL